jgi:hypothetical protein
MAVLESKTGSQTTCQTIIHPPAGAQPSGAILKTGSVGSESIDLPYESMGSLSDPFDSFSSALIVRITVPYVINAGPGSD